jgi:hypothetical protein
LSSSRPLSAEENSSDVYLLDLRRFIPTKRVEERESPTARSVLGTYIAAERAETIYKIKAPDGICV